MMGRKHFIPWYPPAETHIDLADILQAFIAPSGNLNASLCRYLGVANCVSAQSGRALLALLLQALWQRDGGRLDEVLIPGYTCYSVAAAVARSGLKIAVYDLDPRTMDPDIDSVKKAFGKRTLAVIGQHLFGIPAHLGEILAFARQEGVCFIEDAAQGLGGSQSGVLLGTFGDFGLFSFGRGKPLPLGCGASMIGNDQAILDEISIRATSNGLFKLFETAVIQALSSSYLYGIMETLPLGLGKTDFNPDFPMAGLPEVIHRLGEKAINSLERLNAQRRKIAHIYSAMLPADRTIPISDDDRPVFTRYPVMAGAGDIPKNLRRMGVRRMYPQAIIDESSMGIYMVHDYQATPGARELAGKLITLPTHARITSDLARTISMQTKEVFQW
jgi:dTDP-4-amino-4,6-dideoxygalactose transaminase